MAKVRLRRYECDKGRLPQVCMSCGEPSDLEKRKKFAWTPPWVGILILAGLLPYIIVASIMTQRCTVYVPLCNQHKSHWLMRGLIGGLSFFGLLLIGVGLFVLVGILEQNNKANPGEGSLFGFACLAVLGLFIAWIVLLYILQQSAIRPTEITDRTITLTHVSEEFIRAVEGMDDEEEDEWDDRDRRRRPAARDADRRSRPGAPKARERDDDEDDDERDKGRFRK
jgi:hypothetical protein